MWGVLLSDLAVRAPEVKCALVACVEARVVLVGIVLVVVLASNGAVPNERSLLARDVFSHIALRVQLQCLCAWRPPLILRYSLRL